MTFLEIRQRIAELMGLDYSDTQSDNNGTVETKLKEWVNARYRYLAGKRSWTWLIKDGIVQTTTEITTGTVSVTNASTSITFSSAPASSVTGYWIQFDDSDDWYVISAHTASQTSATLTSAYLGDTSATRAYTLRKVYYSLPSDTHKVLDLRETRSNIKLEYLPARLFDKYAANRTQVATPRYYTVLGLDSSRNWRVEFYPVPDASMNIQVRYYQVATELSSDSDVPLIPEQFHEFLIWDTLGTYGFMFLDDTRIDRAKINSKEIYSDMVNNDVSSENIPQRRPFDVDLNALTHYPLSAYRLPIE